MTAATVAARDAARPRHPVRVIAGVPGTDLQSVVG
jgi:hypothetical protein